MKNKIIIFFVFSLVVTFLTVLTPYSVSAEICAPGYIEGKVPTTQVPDYDYTPDGFLEFHFRLTDPNWKYNYGNDIYYYEDCTRIGNYMGYWKTPEKISTWPGVNHLIIRFTYEKYSSISGCASGCFHPNLYNGDTGEMITNIDHYSILGQISSAYYILPLSDPLVVRYVFGNITKTNFDSGIEEGDLISTPALPMKITPSRNPVLIVPGIAGTELQKADDLLWANIPKMFLDPTDSFMDPLAFNQGLTPSDSAVYITDIIRKKPTLDYSKGLINDFVGQGYVEGQTLFTFPYDWRYGVSGKYVDGKTNSGFLAQKIQEILVKTGAQKVDVVAHSMGGLIVKKYVIDNPTSHHIGKAVFVGAPNTGAPEAVKALIQGDNFGIGFKYFGLNDDEMKKLAQNMPGVYDLLPSLQYYNQAGSFVRLLDNTANSSQGAFSVSDQTIVNDLNYDQSKSFLSTADADLNSQALNNAGNLHTQSFDNFDLRTAGVDLYSIDGCKTGTMVKFEQAITKNVFGQTQVSYAPYELNTGDGTVPIESSTNLPIDQSKNYYVLTGEHSKLLSQDGSRQEIVNLISGSSLPVSANLVTQDANQCQLNGKAIIVYSPIDISVTDQTGNALKLVDGNTANQIPNAVFEIWDDHKFVYLPQDSGQTYTINLQGAGVGSYTIDAQSILNGKVAKEEIFSGLPVTAELTGQININPSDNSTTLSIQEDSNTQPQTIPPTKTFDYSSDKIPPEAQIQFDPNAKDIRFTGTDNLSPSQLVSVQDLGSSVILTDQAGNTTEIDFSQKNRKAAMSADINSIKYNGAAVNMASNLFSYSWSLDSFGNLIKLSQKVKSQKNYSISAVYDGKTTKITGSDLTGKISKIFSGLKILKVTTNKGDLSWSY